MHSHLISFLKFTCVICKSRLTEAIKTSFGLAMLNCPNQFIALDTVNHLKLFGTIDVCELLMFLNVRWVEILLIRLHVL